MKTLRHYLFLFVAMIAGFLLFAAVSCLLPNRVVHKNIARSVAYGDLMDDYPRAVMPQKQTIMDNFTDALILQQAWFCSSDSLWLSMMAPVRFSSMDAQTLLLRKVVDGVPHGTVAYPRYWHGNTFLMRYLLLLASYKTLRHLFYIVSTLLLLLMALALRRTFGEWVAVLMTVGLAVMYLFVMEFSIQFVPVLWIALCGVMAVCQRADGGRPAEEVFFVLGALTAFFDLLTIPLLTLGLPLLVVVLKEGREPQQVLRRGLRQIARCGLLWCAAYGGTWVSKWLLASATTRHHVVSDASSAVGYRASTMPDFSRFDAVAANAELLPLGLITVLLVVLVGLAIWRFRREGWPTAVLQLVVSVMPYVWYWVVADHSYEHAWFTYRLQMITAAGLLLAVGSLVDWARLRKLR